MAESTAPLAAEGVRNIIVLGKTGCGKSTLANKIICSSEENETFTVEPHSMPNKIQSSIDYVQIGQKTYAINIIDTIGLFDPQSKVLKADANVLSDLKLHMRERAPEGVSLIIFVINFRRFTEEEKSFFKIIYQHFTDCIKELSCLVITGCDGLTEDARRKLISDFKVDDLTKEYAAMMKKGIYTVGFPKTSNLSPLAKKYVISEMQDDIAPIHNLIADCQMLHLHDEIQKRSLWEKLKLIQSTFCTLQ